MKMKNSSMDSYFTLVGFSDTYWLKIILSVLFFNIYILTLLLNLLLIILRNIDARLHTPMYFFLSHLSFIDIFFPTSTVPKMLVGTLNGYKTISFLGCAAQLFFALGLGLTESLLLATMAYDRYVAICQPLRYFMLMSRGICFLLVAICWFTGMISSFFNTVFTFLLPFCKSRETRHFGCEIQALLRLSCADTYANEIWLVATVVAFAFCAFLLILFSYFHIISTILKTQSSEGKSKVFSTCSSHLLVVMIFYGTVASTYLKPISSYSPDSDRMLFLVYAVVTPMFNPLIYSIRNKEVNAAMRKALGKHSTLAVCFRHMKTSSM